MAEIFLARERSELGAARLVVVKQMLPELASSPAFSELLIAEAKLAARLRHGNVAQVYDLGRHDGLLFIAMEYVEGLDLGELLRRCSRERVPLPAAFALHIGVEMLRGLEHAHRCPGPDGQPMGLVHRDVSPSNVLVSFEGEVKLCDFGIAHANESGAAPSGAIQGKAGYMAPEQARGDSLDARADVFAAAIVLWELLAGRRYYRASEGQSLLAVARQASFQPLPLSDLPHHEQIALVLGRALGSDRSTRTPSVEAMRRDVEAYLDRSGLVTSSLRLGAWLREHFADATVERRHRRERVLQALDLGPPLVLT
ncbi:MAG: serine/threonine protein kinase, partial [Myxococcales bacterium]